MNNKRITNLPAPTDDRQPVTRGYGNSSYLKSGSNIDLGGNFNVQNSKKRTFNQLKSSGGSLVSYDEVRDNFVSINESIGMKTYLDMGDNFIKRVKTPTSNDQASNKSYVDTVGANAVATAASNHPTKQELTNYLKKDGSVAMTGNLNMNNKTIVGLVNPTQNNQPTTKGYSDLQYLHRNGRYSMSGNLNMNNEKIINLKTPISNSDATTKKYVDDRIPNTSSFVKKDGSVAMTGNLDLSNNKVVNLSDPTTDLQAANRGWVGKQIDSLDHHSGGGTGSGVFNISDPTAPVVVYLQYVSGGSSSSSDDFVFTTSRPGQPPVGWAPKSNTFINKIEFQFGSRNINVDFLFFIPRDSS